ncbi:MAG: hypothetical protein SWO11_15135 [Thermodesulfobacteriota bacterium]|nr:hypothetical protein [Thermodesulfobacteriota bacterium]
MNESEYTTFNFETGNEIIEQKQPGLTFTYISRYFSSLKTRPVSIKENRYLSRRLRYKKDPNGEMGKFESVTIMGVSGAMGNEILKRLLYDQILPDCEKIQLFGRPKEGCSGKDKNYYNAIIEKIRDGMGGILPQIELIDSYDAVDGDLLIMCAGKTMSKDTDRISDRTSLKDENRLIFENCARSIKKNPFCSPELVVVVSNPNELSTWIFSKYFKRVVAIGPVLDSLRFQREIRDDLNLSVETNIDCLVGGNHEIKGMVPLKSMLRIDGKEPSKQQWKEIFPARKRDHDENEVYKTAFQMVKKKDQGIFEYINTHSIPIRLAVKPLIEYYCGTRADFPVGIATISVLKALKGKLRSIATLTKKTCIGKEEVCLGVPLLLSKEGIEEIELDSIENFKGFKDDERLNRGIDVFKSKYKTNLS